MKTFYIDTFKTSITRVELNLNLKSLSKFCFNLEKKQQSNYLSNIGGFQSKNLNLNDLSIRELLNAIDMHVNTTGKEIYKFKNKLKISNMWLNINRYKDFNCTHNHPFSILSGVFYVKVPKNSGNIAFVNDFPITEFVSETFMEEFNNYNCKTYNFNSEENVLYIFPSWLKHTVGPNLSQKERISFSFNTQF
jgi:uncharacterized protein (TIGR02466 family)